MYTKSLLITGPKAPKARTSPPVQGKPKNKTRQTGQDQARTRQTKTQKGPDKAKQNWRTTEAPKTCTGYGGCLIQFVTEFQMKFTTVLTVEIFQTSPQSSRFLVSFPSVMRKKSWKASTSLITRSLEFIFKMEGPRIDYIVTRWRRPAPLPNLCSVLKHI